MRGEYWRTLLQKLNLFCSQNHTTTWNGELSWQVPLRPKPASQNGLCPHQTLWPGCQATTGWSVRPLPRTFGQRQFCYRPVGHSSSDSHKSCREDRWQECVGQWQFEKDFERNWDHEEPVSPVHHPALPGDGDRVNDLHHHGVCKQGRHLWLPGKTVFEMLRLSWPTLKRPAMWVPKYVQSWQFLIAVSNP